MIRYRQQLLPAALLLLLASLASLAFVRPLAVPPFEDERWQQRWIWRIIGAGDWLQPLEDGKPLEAWPLRWRAIARASGGRVR